MTRAKQLTDYFSDSARLNVAFSIAKNALIILSNSEYLKKYGEDRILHIISGYLEKNACCIDYNGFISEKTDLMYNDDYLYTINKEQSIDFIKVDLESFLVRSEPEFKSEIEEIEYCKLRKKLDKREKNSLSKLSVKNGICEV